VGTTQSAFSLGASILAASIGFLFAVLGFIVSQWYQRRLERQTISEALLIEILDILDRLLFYQERLDTLDPNDIPPEIGISRDDMQVFMSNTGKIGLLLHGAATGVIHFYSRIRQLVSGVPSRELLSSTRRQTAESEIKELQERVSDAITAGHLAVNSLALQRPKHGVVGGQLREFEKRSLERMKKKARG
jgi:hypothetical protein